MPATYSIIIPHHNIPILLRRCLQSIPKRSDVEVIVVDDRSDDEYQAELKAVAADYPSVHFVMKEKCEGGGAARNTGVENATGKYILFADADDFFNDCMNDVLDDYKDSDFDIIFFKGNSVDTDTFAPAHRADHLNRFADAYLQGKDDKGEQLRYLFGEPWARIISRDLISRHHIRFDETPIHNDTTFAYLVGYHSQNIHVDGRELYCVTVRQGSVSKLSSTDRTFARMEVFGRAENFMHEHHIRYIADRHYEELCVLLVYRQFATFRQSIKILKGMGFTYPHIIKGMVCTLARILRSKFNHFITTHRP